ncbi:MAG: hypothetical protein SV186_02825 [Candidatus Nanohaloarchaea archaeon]|nr:hypothetical protein [Candidatus Nanohaloarchaea archaeon]
MRSCERRARDYFADRFGVDEDAWDGYGFHERGGDIWLVSDDVELREEFVAVGIRLLRDTGIGLKPTTYGLQVLADELQDRVVDLDEAELERLVFDRETLATELDGGYVALRFRGRIIGCGLVSSRGLETQIPKGRAQDLESMLE